MITLMPIKVGDGKMDNMTTTEMFAKSMQDIVEIIYDLTGQLNESTNYDDMADDIELVEKLTTITKRMGDTLVLEPYNEEGEETNVNK
jgi:hypothetical protein